MPTYDVVVIGLGGMGSAAARHLAGRGQRVLGLERFGPAHDRGASHGGSRIIRKAYLEGSAYVPLLMRAYELWGQAEDESGRSLLTTTGGLWLGPEDGAAVTGSRESATRYGLAHETLDAGQIRRRFPTFVPDGSVSAVYEPDAGVLRPEEAVRAHLELAERSGAELRFHTPVRSWRPSGSGVEVSTEADSYTAGALVLTAGAWTSDMLVDLSIPLAVERQVQVWFEPDGGVGPYLPDRHPVFVWEDGNGAVCYGLPAVDPAAGVKAGLHHGGELCTPETLDREVHPDDVRVVRDRVRPLLPTLPGRFLRAATCSYTNTPDEHFVIATHPAHKQVAIACGFSGHGFKFTPVVGEILADLAIDGSSRYPIEMFDPARLTRPGS
ncbi:MAG: N-methyl-L-tryptophan oxidase [Streptosporangiales bacterium]|nr:N-methyl-L-tryptophan oxidase [Streptosporangiales bacterium]